MSFESYMKYREYSRVSHKSYNVNHFINETMNPLSQKVRPTDRFARTIIMSINRQANDPRQ